MRQKTVPPTAARAKRPTTTMVSGSLPEEESALSLLAMYSPAGGEVSPDPGEKAIAGPAESTRTLPHRAESAVTRHHAVSDIWRRTRHLSRPLSPPRSAEPG